MKKFLREVKYILELKKKLISLVILDKFGYSVKTKLGLLKVVKGSLTMMKGEIENDLYTLIGKIVIGVASPVENQKLDKVILWHLRLGYIGQKGLI